MKTFECKASEKEYRENQNYLSRSDLSDLYKRSFFRKVTPALDFGIRMHEIIEEIINNSCKDFYSWDRSGLTKSNQDKMLSCINSLESFTNEFTISKGRPPFDNSKPEYCYYASWRRLIEAAKFTSPSIYTWLNK